MFPKSKMKTHVVKYDVCLDILFVGSIYVTTSLLGKPEIPVVLQTPSSRLGHRYACPVMLWEDGVGNAAVHGKQISDNSCGMINQFVVFVVKFKYLTMLHWNYACRSSNIHCVPEASVSY